MVKTTNDINIRRKRILSMLSAFFMSFTFFSTIEAYAEIKVWQTVGSAGFSDSGATYTSIAIDGSGTPYVVYEDAGNSNKATVKKYNSAASSWETVGSEGFSVGTAEYTSIAIDGSGTPYVVYEFPGNGNKATVKKYNSAASSWETVGSEWLSDGGAYYTSIAIDGSGTPYVIYEDIGNSNKATVKKYNSTTSSWEAVGNEGFSAGTASNTSIAIDGSGTPYVVYMDSGNSNKATVKKYNSATSSWETVGSEGFSVGQAMNTSIAIDGSGTPYVVYRDIGVSSKAAVKKYNSTTSSWETVGSAGFSAGRAFYTTIAIDGSGTPYVVYMDLANGNKATVKKYNSATSSWETVGSVGFSAGQAYYTAIAIDGSGTPYIVYEDSGNSSKTTVMKCVSQATYTLSFTSNGGTAVSDLTGLTSGTAITLPENPTREGYTFGGWYTDPGLTTEFIPSNGISQNTTVYAKWVASVATTYTLKYTAEVGGTIEGDSSQTVNKGDNGSKVTAVADKGYHFANWSDGNTDENRIDTNVYEDIDVSALFETNSSDETTPAGVKIVGTEKVNNTLEAQLIYDDISVTTPAAVTYKWYRISSGDAEDGTLVGEGSTYTLVGDDIGKYIKLVVSYIDETFEDITSRILGNSSSSSGHKNSNSTSTGSSTQQITVNVTDGSNDKTVSQTVIERTTASDGTKTDTVTYTPDKAKETIAALVGAGKDTARIVAADSDTSVAETKVNIPKDTLAAISNGNVNLEIQTNGAIVSLPKDTIQGLSQSGELNGDLYFRLVPIRDDLKQTQIKTTADQQAVVRAVSGNNGVQVLGTPMTIETNMSQRNVDIVLPLTGITLPTDVTERQAFLNDLGVFIEHSDGEKVLEKGQVVEYAGGVLGIKFTVNKFSDFTIVKLNQNNQTGWKLDNGYWYFFDKTGSMITGWYKSESGEWSYDGKDTVGQWFHLGTDGKMDTGWFKDSDGTWYFLCDGKDYGALGYMETGWKFIDGSWYFLKDNGAMATGWTYIDGKWYYLYSDGSMAGNTVINGYKLSASGAWIK